FYFTADDHEQLVYRPKPYGDDAIPAGNGVAARALLRLGHLLGEPRYLEAAEHTLRNAWSAIMELPYGHNTLLAALEETLEPPQLIILRGHGDELRSWQQHCLQAYAPRRLCLAIPSSETSLPGALAGYRAAEGTLAYVCHGTSCSAPLRRLDELDAMLQKGRP
ncbi:MAG: thioredoxin domain-containing protein, partial [Gammaproteobacteria bacterium]